MFAWATRVKKWELTDGRILMLRYHAVILLILPFTFGEQWYLIGDSRNADRELGRSEALALLPAGTTTIPRFEKYAGVIILILIGSSIAALMIFQ